MIAQHTALGTEHSSREDATDEELIEPVSLRPENDPNVEAALEILERRLLALGAWGTFDEGVQ